MLRIEKDVGIDYDSPGEGGKQARSRIVRRLSARTARSAADHGLCSNSVRNSEAEAPSSEGGTSRATSVSPWVIARRLPEMRTWSISAVRLRANSVVVTWSWVVAMSEYPSVRILT